MKNEKICISLIQLNTSDNLAKNFDAFKLQVENAALCGADFVLTPEVTNLITLDHEQRLTMATSADNDIFVNEGKILCKKYCIWLLIGSLVIRENSNKKCFNRSFLINPNGKVCATYDKIHMFDISLSVSNTFKESDFYNPGNEAKLIETDIGKIGLTICYDLRFPILFNDFAQRGANLITVPSAFTEITGKIHWEVLLRARAIETGCFILAPAQCGAHDKNRKRVSFGHSMIVSPWGEVLTSLGNEPGICTHTINLGDSSDFRKKIPSLTNERNYDIQVLTT